jgi:hypothetical protein
LKNLGKFLKKKKEKENLLNLTIFFWETFQRVPFTMLLGTFLKKGILNRDFFFLQKKSLQIP